MALTEDSLQARAVRAYEAGRLRHALLESWPVVPIIAIGIFQRASGVFVLVGGALLLALTTAFSWRGHTWRRAIWPGLLAGAPPLLIPRLAPANSVCWIGGSCWAWCVLLCPLSGLVAGLTLGMVASRHQGGGLKFLIGAASIAAATGAFGCSVAGAWGIMGMLAGGLLGLLPIQVRDQLH
ncbi:MAG TPA: hypothetical protein VN918_02435 [Myxococcaceae bacterium]|nr:hypothetical protein [Myxococcaceae bacterium]